MSRAADYQWIWKPGTRPPPRPSTRARREAGRVFLEGPCDNCGWEPLAWFKKCPACFVMVPR